MALSQVESSVVRWLCEGKSNWEISRITSLSQRMVRFHLSNVFTRLGVESRSKLIAQYQWSSSGLVPREASMEGMLNC